MKFVKIGGNLAVRADCFHAIRETKNDVGTFTFVRIEGFAEEIQTIYTREQLLAAIDGELITPGNRWDKANAAITNNDVV